MNFIEFAGVQSQEEALKMWQAEREAMLELHDQNTALKIHNRRIRLTLNMCVRVLELLDGQMFLPDGVGKLVTVARKQIEIIQRDVLSSKLLCE
jgi:hypothetical protein